MTCASTTLFPSRRPEGQLGVWRRTFGPPGHGALRARPGCQTACLHLGRVRSPKAQAAYERINADFKRDTGISVTMEYPGFTNIAKRVATLIAAGTPADLVWYGAGTALEVAVQGQLANVDDLVEEVNAPQNLRLVVNGHNRSIPTSQQFVYAWYRSDLYEKAGLKPYTDWESYLSAVRALNKPPQTGSGNLIPSTALGASHLLMFTMLQKNDAHWFRFDPAKKEYEVALNQGENLARAVETLDFLHEAHASSPEASNYNWAELMSEYSTGKLANSYYVGAHLLEQVQTNNPELAPVTKAIALPPRKTDSYYISVQGFHIGEKSNVEGAKNYVRFFLKHPAYIDWLHSVPLHIIPAKRETLRSEAYLKNETIQKRMDVLEFLESVLGAKARRPIIGTDRSSIRFTASIRTTASVAGCSRRDIP